MADDPKNDFIILPPSVWQLSDKIGDARRNRLLTTPYEQIVAGIVSHMRVVDYQLEKIYSRPGDETRAVIRLELPCELVDAFHNGAGGYRPQYYESELLGEAANRYFIDACVGPIIEHCVAHPAPRYPEAVIAASLRHRYAKGWIDEAGILTNNNPWDWHLNVDRWRQNISIRPWPLRDELAPYHAWLMPHDETEIHLKGGWLDANFAPIDINLKSRRSRDIREHGYT